MSPTDDKIIIGLAQVNPTVGDLDGNCRLAEGYASAAYEKGAQIVVFPELMVSGYPPEDLIFKQHFIADCEERLNDLAKRLPPGICAVIGSPERSNGATYNSAAIVHAGKIQCRYRKNKLPNYGVFDEKRVFVAGEQPLIFSVNGARLAMHICEDSWCADENELRHLRDAGVSAIISISASPFHRRRVRDREDMVVRCAQAAECAFVYVNMVGGQDELVFDGASMVSDAEGQIFTRAAHFHEDLLICAVTVKSSASVADISAFQSISIDLPANGFQDEHRLADVHTEEEEIYSALKLGLRDYVAKNKFRDVVIAISGGIDSALVATIAVDALGARRVTGVTLPSQYTTSGTLVDASDLADNLGIEMHTIPIKTLYDEFVKYLHPLWPDRGEDVTEENLQARIRGDIVMAISNKFGQLVLSTGNKSELAVGYCTLYGDMVGGFTLLKDTPKTLVYSLARWRNSLSDKPVIPVSTIERAPSAELRPDQKDSDSLPPYDILDAILDRYIEQDQHVDEIIRAGFDAQTVVKVVRMVDMNEYKRRQGAPGIKITPKAFGRDRRMPITNRYRHQSSLT